MRRTLLAAALSLGLGAVGCAYTPQTVMPLSRLVEPRATIRAAEEVGAEQVPEAARHLELARREVNNAEQLLAEEDYEAADLALQQASADADLALALAHTVPLQQEAQQLRGRADAARQSVQQ